MLQNWDICDNSGFFDLVLLWLISSKQEMQQAIYNAIRNTNAWSEMPKVTEYCLPALGMCYSEG